MTKVSFFLINDKQGGVCSHTLLCDYHELLEDLLHFFFQPVHMPVNRLFGNLQIPGYFMSAIPLDLHQNDLKGKPVHGDQHMIQFLILNTIQKVLYCFQFCLICGCCYGIQICTCSIMASVIFLYHISNPEKNLGCRCRQYLPDQHPVFYCSKLSSQSSKLFLEMRYFPPSNWIHRNSFFFKRL